MSSWSPIYELCIIVRIIMRLGYLVKPLCSLQINKSIKDINLGSLDYHKSHDLKETFLEYKAKALRSFKLVRYEFGIDKERWGEYNFLVLFPVLFSLAEKHFNLTDSIRRNQS